MYYRGGQSVAQVPQVAWALVGSLCVRRAADQGGDK